MPNLTDLLNIRVDALSELDSGWVTFVNDHISQIIKNSTSVTVTAAAQDRYRMKFAHFLRDNGGSPNLDWIAVMINNVSKYEDFTVLPIIMVPQLNYITNLYRLYRTSRNNAT